jgi:hypothetical protein
LLFLLLFGAAAGAAEPSVFEARTADGKVLRGPLERLGKDGALRLGGPKGGDVAAGNLLALRQVGRELPPFPEDQHLILANGDRFPVEAVKLKGERLYCRSADLGDAEVSLPLGALVLLWREAPAGPEAPERLRRRLAEERRKRDAVLLANGDRVEGVLSALDEKKLTLEAEGKGKPTTVEVGQVAVLAMSTELPETLLPRGEYWRAVLLGAEGGAGARLALTEAACDGASLTGKTLFGATLRVPVARVAALDRCGGRNVWLSDLKPARYEYVNYLDERWPLALDSSVAGNDLRLGGSTHAKGLGMHAHSRATFALSGGYRRFEALVGLDPKTGRAGTASVKVLADGKVIFEERELTAAKPATVSVDVAGVKELTLEVGLGRRGPVQAHVNWADARLVK